MLVELTDNMIGRQTQMDGWLDVGGPHLFVFFLLFTEFVAPQRPQPELDEIFYC